MKVRLVGAAVLVSLAVIFIPMILDGREVTEQFIESSNIPPKPDRDFVSKVIPLVPETPKPKQEVVAPVINPQQAAKIAMASDTKDKPAPEKTDKQNKVASKLASETRTGISAWAVQIGSFSSKKNAYTLRDKLRDKGFAAFVETLYEQDTPSFRVRVGPELKKELAEKLQKKVANVYKGKTFIVKHPS